MTDEPEPEPERTLVETVALLAVTLARAPEFAYAPLDRVAALAVRLATASHQESE